MTLGDAQEMTNAYLLPDFEDDEVQASFIRFRAKKLFEHELEAWCADPEKWPSLRGHEVDFVLQSGERIVSLEVKSGRARSDYSGIDAFAKNFQPFRKLLVGGQGIPLEEFLATPISHWVE